MAVIPPREYSILLSQLHKPSSSLPLSTHQSLISHFLAQTPTPTPLTATVISSPLFRPFSHAKLATLVTAFRHAVHLRIKALEDEERNLFTRGIRPRVAEWVRGLVKGFKGGQALIRFVSAGGILLGLDDLVKKLGPNPGSGSVRARTEDELIVALTEILELYDAPKDSAWEKEFQPETEHGEREFPFNLLTCVLFNQPHQWTLSHLPCCSLPNSCLTFSPNASRSCLSPYVCPLTHPCF